MNFPLWSDEPSDVDLLAFRHVAETVADSLLDERLDPVAIGISGRWGSGKTTILKLISADLEKRNSIEPGILILTTNPWRYDPAMGVKETLISEVLNALDSKTIVNGPAKSVTKKLLDNLKHRLDWAQTIRIAAKTSIALQIPTLDDITKLLKGPDKATEQRGMESFRQDFEQLMKELIQIRRVIVLVDDLDRCLPTTVVESLEAIKLFLAVPKMSFVIAADEERVAEAIGIQYKKPEQPGKQTESVLHEDPAQLYLHKIVQTTVPVPALSRFDTEMYLFLLQILIDGNTELTEELIRKCESLRGQVGSLASLRSNGNTDLTVELAFAESLTPILYEKLHGNPRRIKRFLNDLHVRQSISKRRGIELATSIIVKMMVLEQLMPGEFKKVLEWLSEGTLQAQVANLEKAAQIPADTTDAGRNGDRVSKDSSNTSLPQIGDHEVQRFSDLLLRWARLAPPLCETDLTAYLNLAASCANVLVLLNLLPKHLHDLADKLLSTSRTVQHSVSDDDLKELPVNDAEILLRYLGHMIRERPADQKTFIDWIIRISRQHPPLKELPSEVLWTLNADEITTGSLLLFEQQDTELRPILEKWAKETNQEPTRKTIEKVIRGWS